MLMKAGRSGTGRALPIPGSYALAATVVVAVAAVALAAASLASGAYAALEFAHMFDDEDIDGGAIDGPYDVALSENGRDVYVVEKNKDRISIFSKDGSFDDRFGSTGTRNLEFSDPVSIIRPDRLFFVLDAGNNRIQVVDKDGTFEREFDSDRLSSPTDIAMDTATQRVFISDAGGDRIHVFSPDGTYKGEIKKFNTTDMSDPSGLVVDVLGRYLYVSDTGKHRIGIFSILTETQDCRNGTVETKAPGICYVGEFGTAGIVGTANGTFNGPTGLAIDKKAVPNRGELYVSDTGNARIQIFSFLERGGGTSCPDGTQNLTDVVCYVGKYGSFGDDNGKFKSPHGIAIDTKNRLLYVADTGNNRVQVIKLDAQSASLSPQSGTSGGGSSSTTTTTTTTTVQKPNPPHNVRAVPISPTSILVDWDEPRQRGDSVLPIVGYAVEYKSKAATGTSVTDFTTITSRTSTNATALYHTDLDPGTTYTYRVSAVASGADAVSTPSTTAPTQPAETTTPTMVDIVAMSPTYVKMTWLPPSNTYNQPLNGYVVQEKIGRSYFTVDDGEVGRSQLSFTYNVDVDSDNSFHVYAKIGDASTPPSNPVSISTVGSPFHTGVIEPYPVKLVSLSEPSPPIKVSAKPVNDRHIEVTWSPPADDGNLDVTGYTVEAKKKGSSSFTEIASGVTGTKYAHRGLEPGSEYTYRVYATNAQGTSGASNESTAEARIVGLVINSVGSLTVDEGKPATFIVTVSGDASSGAALSLANEPEGASIVPGTGAFSWTPSYDQGGKTYTFDVVAARGEHSDKKTVRIKVNDVQDADMGQQQQQARPEEPRDAQQPDAGTGLAPFVDESVDPQTYVDRYNAEPSYKEWYDSNYLAEYGSIYDAVGVLQVPASFVDESVDPQTYVDRYNSEPSYKEWFDAHYSEYDSIYHAVGLDDPAAVDDTSGGAVGGDGDGAGTGEPALDETDSGETPDEPARPELRLDVPLAPFVDESVDPQTYVDRYNAEPSYKEWYDANYADEYGTIYRAVGLFEIPAPFVDESVDPQTYVDRYNAEPSYKEWFDQNYAEYFSIYHAVGLPEPDVEEPEPPAKQYGICGPGTKLIEGVCTIVNNE